MEKKNFNKKPSKRVSNKPTDELTKKRYSKSKFKKDVCEEQPRQESVIKQRITKKKKEYKIEEKHQFVGNVIRTWYGILTKQSMQKKGYNIITKGQCVKVKEFVDDSLVRLTANDGRIGITNLSDIKRMNFR